MLKSLEINGFKSFGKKSVITIDSPITAIVGPNGSGKSNVVEAIRFVLGEQSIKSLRGKGQSDLLFKGSKNAGPSTKLKVSIVFDNKNRRLALPNESGKEVSLNFDEVVISRELYADNKSVYSISGTEVRLKDVSELLSQVHIGSSGHHIISQGEADRLLSANAKERRSMIDDALGLRVYEMRIRDAERKLEKSKQNISEIEAARRELVPHVKFLQRQVEKLNEAEEARRELSKRYFHYEMSSYGILTAKENEIRLELFRIDTELVKYGDEIEEGKEYDTTEINSIRESLAQISVEKSGLLRVRENLERSLGRAQGLIEALRTPRKKPNTNIEERIQISRNEFTDFCTHISDEIDVLVSGDGIHANSWKESLLVLSQKVKTFLSKYRSTTTEIDFNDDINKEELENAVSLESDLQKQINENIQAISVIEKDETILKQNLFVKEGEQRSYEADLYKSRIERARLIGEKNKISADLDHILSDILLLREERKIFEPFLIASFDTENHEAPLSKESLQNERRSLERLRMKLEEVGGGSGSDIIKEYEDAKSRDEYLSKELEDLHNTISSLISLIHDLRNTIREKFAKGIDTINTEFGTFFKAMFGGGNAFLSLVSEYKKPKINILNEDDLEDSFDDDESSLPKFERGVDIHVDLPNKKVKELSMLSGGERSLVSIALLFAMSQVNPPPFLVLDETDAALDEANSRRYGDMLERLSKETQLIVVTHNRETMSRAGTIFGVTMGHDSVSKLLSIEFNDAVKVAK